MNAKKCTGCAGGKVSTVTMSEASWERHEYNHVRQKLVLFIVALVATALLFATNAMWIILTAKTSYNNTIEENRNDTTELYQTN